MAKIIRKSPAPLYLAAAVWVGWAFAGPMYRLHHFAIAAAVSVGAYFLGRKFFRDRVIVVPDPEPEPETTGNPEIDALIAERDRALSEMRRLNDNIEDEQLSAQIDHLEQTTQKIIGHVVEQPQKLPQIRRFMNYYLPTTLKLLNAYDRMDASGVSGVNIDGVKGRIETMMDTVVRAYDRQLEALFTNEVLDISAEITVMEQMLAREGVGGTQIKDDQITLEL